VVFQKYMGPDYNKEMGKKFGGHNSKKEQKEETPGRQTAEIAMVRRGEERNDWEAQPQAGGERKTAVVTLTSKRKGLRKRGGGMQQVKKWNLMKQKNIKKNNGKKWVVMGQG